MRMAGDPGCLDSTLYLGRFNFVAAHDAGPASSSAAHVGAIGERQAPLDQSDSYLLLQLLL